MFWLVLCARARLDTRRILPSYRNISSRSRSDHDRDGWMRRTLKRGEERQRNAWKGRRGVIACDSQVAIIERRECSLIIGSAMRIGSPLLIAIVRQAIRIARIRTENKDEDSAERWSWTWRFTLLYFYSNGFSNTWCFITSSYRSFLRNVFILFVPKNVANL